jgi:hypothetical protein
MWHLALLTVAVGSVVAATEPGAGAASTEGHGRTSAVRTAPSSASSSTAARPSTPSAGARASTPSTRRSASNDASVLSRPSLLEGAYVGPASPSGLAAFDLATKTTSRIASDYLPDNYGWSGVDGSGGSLWWLLAKGWSGTGYTLSLGVPMIPENAAGRPLGTLRVGATGAYDKYFVILARTLIAAGESNAYLRLGWEFDGAWFAWRATTPAAERQFAAYFRHIVVSMRSVRGGHFRFVWNPTAPAFTDAYYKVGLAYPGNAYVNEIGLDDYDQTWVTPQTPANEWDKTTLPALRAAEKFAKGKEPLAIDEWGVAIITNGHGLGDDPLYIDNFIAWMKNPKNDVAYESYFDYNTLPYGGNVNADLTGGAFPQSLTAFIADLGAGARAEACHPGCMERTT